MMQITLIGHDNTITYGYDPEHRLALLDWCEKLYDAGEILDYEVEG